MYFHIVFAFLCSCLHAEQLTYDYWLENKNPPIFITLPQLASTSDPACNFITDRMQRIAQNDNERQVLHPAIAFLESCWMSGDRCASELAFDIVNDYYHPTSQESHLFQITGFQWGSQEAKGRNELAYQRGRVRGALVGDSMRVHESFQVPDLREACQTYSLAREWATFFVTTNCEPDWMWDAQKKPWESNEGRSLKAGLVPSEESERKWLCQALDSIAPQWPYSLCAYRLGEPVKNLLETAVSLGNVQAKNTLGSGLLESADNNISESQLQRGIQLLEEARLEGGPFAADNLGIALIDNEKVRVCFRKMYPQKDPIMLSVDWLSRFYTLQGADVLRRHLAHNTPGVREARTQWLEKNKNEIAGQKSDEPILWAKYFLLMDSWDDNRFGCALVINEDGLRTAMCEMSCKREGDLIEVGLRALIEESEKRNIDATLNLAYYLLVDQSGVRNCFDHAREWIQWSLEKLLLAAEESNLLVVDNLELDWAVNRLKELTDDQISDVLGSCDEASRSSLKKRIEDVCRGNPIGC